MEKICEFRVFRVRNINVQRKASFMTSISIKRGLKYLLHDRAHFCDSMVVHFLGFLPDKPYLSLRYRCNVGHWMSWKHPKTFTEKLQWLKVYGFRPEYTKMVDKYAVKDYVAGIIGEEHIIPTLGVWDRVEDIDWDSLPTRFVLKTTHGGGGSGVVICKDKATFDRKVAMDKLQRNMKGTVVNSHREHPYYGVPRRIIAEQFLEETARPDLEDIMDYKFFCFDGEPRFLYVSDSPKHESVFLNTDWTLAGIGRDDYKSLKDVPAKPDNLDEMMEIARKLAKDIPHARVDLYNIGDHIYFSEITFYTGSGYIPFNPKSCDELIGAMLKLPENQQTKIGGGKIIRLIDGEITVTDVQPSNDIKDYKFFCFDGEPRYCQVIRDRNTKETIDFYDMDWNHMPFVGLNPVAKNGVAPVAKPPHMDKMQEICRKLSAGNPFTRVDLYVVNDREYFGELTFYPASGFGVFTPEEWDGKLGELIRLEGRLSSVCMGGVNSGL